MLAVVAGAVALDQRGHARTEATAAEAQRLGARALVEDDLDLSLLLARQGVALDDSPQTRGNLLAALLKSPAAIGVLRGDGDRLIALDLSPDERTLAFVDIDGTLTFVDPRTRRPAGPPATVPGHVGIIDARSGSTTCGSAPTAHGSPSAAKSRSSWTRAPIACSPGCGSRPDGSSTRCASRPTGARCSPPSPTRRRHDGDPALRRAQRRGPSAPVGA